MAAAIDCFYTSADINSCEFFSNSTGGTFTYGGGINLEGAGAGGIHTIINSLFAGNSSSYDGGAVACEDASVTPLIQNCTFSQNTASQSGGSIYADSSARRRLRTAYFKKAINTRFTKITPAEAQNSVCSIIILTEITILSV